MAQPDNWIRKQAIESNMIEPFVDHLVRYSENGDKIVSYGLSSYGYDLRVANEFKVFTNVFNSLVDPKKFNDDAFVDIQTNQCVIPPNSFALARSVEYFRIPENVIAFCIGKSTYARCGVIVNVTPFEPGWQGYVTIEISNTTPLPVIIHAEEGIAQVVFFAGEKCDVSYADRKGKYMYQIGIVGPSV